ncbi:hypothetical protein NA57DRAFT_77079 [Rhizodiscina lignyota]|uniref:Carboxymuconolactone decarboxylase-like domain-containing protein n=1 Tax=Rhizodiscina lignyota TaxID=1504668 RepID=A0A9P4M5W2_9PEZI|nr:hypothetical protein NA57DRAFT_77079 [Rhizodiscina lignyota]
MRLTYVDHSDNKEDQEFIDELTKERAERGVPLGAIYKTLLGSPTICKSYHVFFNDIRYHSSVPAGINELGICRVAALNGAAYQWAAHNPLMKKGGVSEEGAETVRTAPLYKLGEDGEGGLTKREWLVLRYADHVTNLTVTDEVFKATMEVMDNEQQMLELTMAIAAYNATSRVLRALDVGEMQHTEVGKGVHH